MLSALCAVSLLAACRGGGVASATAAEATFDTLLWARVPERHHSEGGIDYRGFQSDREDLDAFLTALERAQPAAWTREEQLAF